jgi:hypothetical protein
MDRPARVRFPVKWHTRDIVHLNIEKSSTRLQRGVDTNNSQAALTGQDHLLYATLVLLQMGLFPPFRPISGIDFGIGQTGY